MAPDEIETRVFEELQHIPRGGLEQNLFRSIYQNQRAANPGLPPADVLRAALAAVGNSYPGFQPVYHDLFFKRPEL